MQRLVAEQLLQEGFADAEIRRVEDGFVVFDTSSPPAAVKKPIYVNNCFVVLARGTESIADFLGELAARRDWQDAVRECAIDGERTFRIVLSDQNHLVAAERSIVARLGEQLCKVTRLRWSPRGADAEFWVLRRRSSAVFLCKRLPEPRRHKRELRRGELRPELADLLCRLAEPSPDDVFLDPFGGSGAIGFARAHSPFGIIFLYDSDPALVDRIKSDLKAGGVVWQRKGHPIIARVGDARRLERIQDAFIDKIVTDPPWGEFDCHITDLAGLYRSAFAELVRVTKPGGIIVMLLGRNAATASLRTVAATMLTEVAAFDLLVSGKKAVVIKWRKARETGVGVDPLGLSGRRSSFPSTEQACRDQADHRPASRADDKYHSHTLATLAVADPERVRERKPTGRDDQVADHRRRRENCHAADKHSADNPANHRTGRSEDKRDDQIGSCAANPQQFGAVNDEAIADDGARGEHHHHPDPHDKPPAGAGRGVDYSPDKGKVEVLFGCF